MKFINKAIKIFNKIEELAMVILTMGFGALIIYEIVVRALGLKNIAWLQEFSCYMLIYTTLLGSSMAVKHEGHMAMDTLLVTLPKKVVKVLKVIINIVCSACWMVVTYYGWKWVVRLKLIGTTADSVSLKQWIIWIPIVFFFFTTTIRFIIQLVKSIVNVVRKEKEIENEGGNN